MRNYSTDNSVVPVIKYSNADTQKLQIINENRGKSGVYCWTNQLNGRRYVGSSVNLARRFTDYFKINYISDEKYNMLINKALLKHGYANFTVEILEYCELDMLRSREQHFLDLLEPEYNMLKTAGSLLGFKHSEETIAKLKARFKDRVFTSEHIEKLSAAKLGNKNGTGGKGRERAEGAGNPSVQIEVFNLETGIKTIYPSMSEAGKALDLPSGSIRMYLSRNSKKPYKGIYFLPKLAG